MANKSDSRTVSAESVVLNAEVTIGLCRQLWQQGGLAADSAEALLNTVPVLRRLLQPIVTSTESDIISAYSITAPLLDAFPQLGQSSEWQLALCGLNPKVRSHWLSVAAARCREAGTMHDPQVLVKLIQQLGNASEWVVAKLEDPNAIPEIAAGPLAFVERNILGHSLNDNAAIPALCRILRTCFILHCISEQSEPQPPIPAVDLTGKHLSANWCAGRILALPNTLLNEQSVKPNADWLLISRPCDGDASYLELFSHQPWLFLLGLITFVQDAWAAEQRGGLLLTLPAGQNAFAPSQICVVVQGIEGDGVSLGSLAEFIVQLLGELNIALYPALDSSTENSSHLNRALSPLIAELLVKKIWQFAEAGRGEPGHYRIHPTFSDACYSLPLAPLFGYKSQPLQHAIKQLAQKGYASRAGASAAKRTHLEGS